MILTDLDIARKVASLYAGPEGFGFYQPGAGDAGICWALQCCEGYDLIVLRGSATMLDWIRDLFAFTLPFSHSVFGPVHPGFMIGMDRMLAQLLDHSPLLRPKVIAGHSLGAARAANLSALLVESSAPPLACVTFGQPKPGFQRFADYIAHVPQRSYCNGDGVHHHDLITDAPLTLPPLERYVHPSPLIHVVSHPHDSGLGIFAYHHMGLYLEALSK